MTDVTLITTAMLLMSMIMLLLMMKTMTTIMMMDMMMMMMGKVSIEPVERWERGILALKIIDELTMWFFTLGDSDDDGDAYMKPT